MRTPVWRPVLLFAAAMPLSASAHDGLPVGWRLVSPEPGAFSARVDREQKHGGHASVLLEGPAEDIDSFGTLMQTIRADDYLGRRVRLSGWLRSRGLERWAGLWMRVTRHTESPLASHSPKPINTGFEDAATSPAAVVPVLEIETASDHPDERAVAETARRMIDRHKVDRWLFTRRIRVDRTAPMPRSHPVLTLDTGSRDENEILSSLLHEQFHWLALADQKRLGAVVGDLRARYPDAPSGPPDGGRDLNGTYLHLVVNALELQAMERLLGRAAAEKMLRVRPYYRWIYRTVIEDREAIGEIFARHGVTLP